jgi:hypothetical protein
LYRETHNAYENLCQEGKNRAVHSLPTAFIELCEEAKDPATSGRLSNVYELYRLAVSLNEEVCGHTENSDKTVARKKNMY